MSSSAIVAPYTGAWIEIATYGVIWHETLVAPYTGAWIEIMCCTSGTVPNLSLPTRERGLKYIQEL